mgnify:CR=1 FL=1
MAQSPSSHATFRSVFEEHHDAIHRYCLRRLGIDDANEATAEVFLVAWRRVERLPRHPEVLPWLYGVARNVVRNHRRGHHRRARLLGRLGSVREVPGDEPELQVVRHHQEAEVHEALQRLRPEDQELLRLKAWEGLSNSQIGDLLGMSHRAVEGRYPRALKKLSKHLTMADQRDASPRLAQEGGEQ